MFVHLISAGLYKMWVKQIYFRVIDVDFHIIFPGRTVDYQNIKDSMTQVTGKVGSS